MLILMLICNNERRTFYSLLRWIPACYVGRLFSRDALYRVAVSDPGNGIPPEFQHYIFNKFAQADPSDTRQKGGTGLGLSISKDLVEKFGGQINFYSNPEAGTTFYFDLPEMSSRLKVERILLSKPSRPVVEWLDKPFDATLLLETVTQTADNVGISFQTSRPHILHVENDADLVKVVRLSLQPYADYEFR